MSTSKKVTQLTELEAAAQGDLLPIVDVSEGETKKITKANLLKEVQEDIDDTESLAIAYAIAL
ncbi:TPA: hypothetical protein DEB29_03450 [Candidatus Wolfebacteria bacterium]|nr:hypothetical protein [Candidatus Wolfebacteria bacterium]